MRFASAGGYRSRLLGTAYPLPFFFVVGAGAVGLGLNGVAGVVPSWVPGDKEVPCDR